MKLIRLHRFTYIDLQKPIYDSTIVSPKIFLKKFILEEETVPNEWEKDPLSVWLTYWVTYWLTYWVTYWVISNTGGEIMRDRSNGSARRKSPEMSLNVS
jgi:hypothetical protein